VRLRHFVYELSDLLPGTVRGLIMPSGKYLNLYAEYLNHLLAI
jgi:hypothetical protein